MPSPIHSSRCRSRGCSSGACRQECRRRYLARQQEQVTGLQRAVRQVADAEGDVDAVADDVVAAVVAGDAEVEVGMLLDEGCQVTGEVALTNTAGIEMRRLLRVETARWRNSMKPFSGVPAWSGRCPATACRPGSATACGCCGRAAHGPGSVPAWTGAGWRSRRLASASAPPETEPVSAILANTISSGCRRSCGLVAGLGASCAMAASRTSARGRGQRRFPGFSAGSRSPGDRGWPPVAGARSPVAEGTDVLVLGAGVGGQGVEQLDHAADPER